MVSNTPIRAPYTVSDYFSTGHLLLVLGLSIVQGVVQRLDSPPAFLIPVSVVSAAVVIAALTLFVKDYRRAPWSTGRCIYTAPYIVVFAALAVFVNSAVPLLLGMLASILAVKHRLAEVARQS